MYILVILRSFPETHGQTDVGFLSLRLTQLPHHVETKHVNCFKSTLENLVCKNENHRLDEEGKYRSAIETVQLFKFDHEIQFFM